MSAAAMQQTPAVPPRPARGSDKDASIAAMPKVPPRPVNKRLERSMSPNSERFAPSPLNEGINKSASPSHYSYAYGRLDHVDDPIDRSGSVPMPSVGEEGMEYSAVADELKHDENTGSSRPTSPEQTRMVAEDLKLHAPKPSLPAHSAKQRVAAVTRTDSDKAASFGIGRPSFEDRASSRDGVKKKPSSVFSTNSDLGHQTDDDHGIPEIGQRVPMNPHLGDVQAPSPAPGAEGTKRNHVRKLSARNLPPGSYGLHGHGVQPQDNLDKSWYQKHPEQLEREHSTPLHDRQNDFAMSSADLNKLVRASAGRAAVSGTSVGAVGTPTEEVGFQASEEYASRMSSPRPASTAPKGEYLVRSPLQNSLQVGVAGPDDETIHVEDDKHPEYRSFGNDDPDEEGEESDYHAPILAEDEVSKDPNACLQQPAIHPMPERRGSAFELEDAPSRPSSRPTSRPTSLHQAYSQAEFDSTRLEDVMEYEPLFADETQEEKEKRELEEAEEHKARHHFPSKDIWEDAPNSVHYTAQVSTPELSGQPKRKLSAQLQERPLTPAQAFAQHQEELAERESKGNNALHGAGNTFLALSEDKPTWIAHQAHLRPERPSSGPKFPSRDIWEDAPESQLQQTTITPSPKPDEKPQIPSRPTKKLSDPSERPGISDRPEPKSVPADYTAKVRPPVSDKPKPQIPARPVKSLSGDSKDGETSSKPKPPVPNRPVGGKIAALQAGFMNDLNKRLQLGPQAPKKEEPPQEATEEEKAPLSDARKSRARGPQRRAPAKNAAAPAASAETKAAVPTLSFSLAQTVWSIDPEDDSVGFEAPSQDEPAAVEKADLAAESEKIPEAAEPEHTGEEPQELVHAETLDKTEPAEEIEKVEEPEKDAEEAEKPDTHIEDAEKEIEEEPVKEEKTLVANMAGESILETTVEKKADGNEVEPVEVDDAVKS